MRRGEALWPVAAGEVISCAFDDRPEPRSEGAGPDDRRGRG